MPAGRAGQQAVGRIGAMPSPADRDDVVAQGAEGPAKLLYDDLMERPAWLADGTWRIPPCWPLAGTVPRCTPVVLIEHLQFIEGAINALPGQNWSGGPRGSGCG